MNKTVFNIEIINFIWTRTNFSCWAGGGGGGGVWGWRWVLWSKELPGVVRKSLGHLYLRRLWDSSAYSSINSRPSIPCILHHWLIHWMILRGTQHLTGFHILCRSPIFQKHSVWQTDTLNDTPGYTTSDRFSYTLSLTDIPETFSCDRPWHPGLLNDTPGNSVADRSSYTLSLTDIPVDLYTPSVYPRLLTDTSEYMQLAGLHILCRWLIFGCTLQVTGRYTLGYWLIHRFTVQLTGLGLLCCWPNSPVYSPCDRPLYPR